MQKQTKTIVSIIIGLIAGFLGWYVVHNENYVSMNINTTNLNPEIIATKPKDELLLEGCKWDWYTGPKSGISLWRALCKEGDTLIEENPSTGGIAFKDTKSGQYLSDFITPYTNEYNKSPIDIVNEKGWVSNLSKEYQNKCHAEQIVGVDTYKIPDHKTRYKITLSESDWEKWNKDFGTDIPPDPCGDFGEGASEMNGYFEFDDRSPYRFIFLSFVMSDPDYFDFETIQF